MEAGGGEGGRKGRLGPSLLSHGGPRHDISGLKGLVFWTLPSPLAIALYPPFEHPPPPFRLSPVPVWMWCLAGRVEGAATVCMQNKGPLKDARGSRELHMDAAKRRDDRLSFVPSQAPLLARTCCSDPSTPFFSSVPLAVTPSFPKETLAFLLKKKKKETPLMVTSRDLG